MWDVVVVGAGPNGLTAAARLARAGRRVLVVEAAPTIGGGSRTKPLTDDARYDVCAAVHPFGASSPAFEALRLCDHGLSWLHPPTALAHPFDDGDAAVLHRDLTLTIDGLGADRARWQRLVGRLSRTWQESRVLATGPVLDNLAHHPIAMARFGVVAGLPATTLARWFRTREAKALLLGFAAHSGVSLHLPATSGVAVALAAAAHAVGMPVAAGGSQAIVDALAAVIQDAGGEIRCDHLVTSLDDIPAARGVLLDLVPAHMAALLGRSAPRWRHGVAAWKLDLLLSGEMPWTAAPCRGAGTVHLGGEGNAVDRAERATARGHIPDTPYVIVTQPSVADPSRAPVGKHVVWAYRHVPNGCDAVSASGGIERQFDRFAPGWRDLVLHRQVTTAADFAAYNSGYVGGDIAGGAMTPWQTVARPRLSADPYRVRGRDDMWLCSQSTPPGPGVHGMCGWHAAGSVLRHS